MLKQLSAAIVGILVFTAAAAAQPAGKEETLKELELLVEDLRPKSGKFMQSTYNKLMSRRPLPKELAPVLAKLIATEKGYPRTIAAAVLAEITPTDESLVKILAEGLQTKEAISGAAALNGLERMGPLAKPALPQVLAALEFGPVPLKIATIPLVAGMGKEAIDPLEKIIQKALNAKKTKYDGKNDQAAMALGKIGPDAMPTIMRFFDADDPGLEYHAAVACKSMDKKPIEALKPMVRILKNHKDSGVRRIVIAYLGGINPPTDAVIEALYMGMNDANDVLVRESYQAVRSMPHDPKKWSAVLVKYHQQSPGRIGTMRELVKVDRAAAGQLMPAFVNGILRNKTTTPDSMVHLALMEKELEPVLPQIHRIMNEPIAKSANARQNAALLLFSLPPEHSFKVQKQLAKDLEAPTDLHKLYAARALLRTKPANKAGIGRALAGAIVSNKLGGFTMDEVLGDLRRLGPDARDAFPQLRVALFKDNPTHKFALLRTLAAIDPDQKDAVVAIARKMYESKTGESYIGATVLHELGVLSQEETLKLLQEGLETKGSTAVALALIRELGPKAKALAPQLEAMLAQPKYGYPAQTVLALGKIDGNTKKMLDRLLPIAREQTQYSNVERAFEVIGPDARTALPALLELRNLRILSRDTTTMVRLVDPQLLGTLMD